MSSNTVNEMDFLTLQKKLQAYNWLLRETEQIAKLGHWYWNIKQDKIKWSHNLYLIYGIKKSNDYEINFNHFLEAIHPNDRNHVASYIQKSIQDKQFIEYYHRIIRPDGSIRILHARGKVILNTMGKPIKMIGTGQDVTDSQTLEKELFFQKEILKEKNKELQQFAYIISHDLQEPLRKILINSSILKEKYSTQLSNDISIIVDKIASSSKRMRELIKGVLEISTNEDTPQFELTDLNLVLSETINDLEELLQIKVAEIKSDFLPTIDANKIQMRQLFQNLISNAIKFNKNNPKLNITGKTIFSDSLKHSDKMLYQKLLKIGISQQDICLLRFIDNGIGFDEKLADQLFIPFTSVHSRNEFEGTGIGLSIVKRIVDIHHGIIQVNSKQGIGSSFLVILPIIQKRYLK